VTTGGPARLRVAASDGTTTQVADVSPGAPGRAFGLAIALAEYFPDFALDENQRPFSRSAEPRNPAALLTVARGGEGHRVFVLQSMPGVHRVEGLGLAFSLLEVAPERAVAIAVHREPAALAVLAGALLLAAGVALSYRFEPGPASGDREAPVTAAAVAFLALLVLADRGAVLAWTFTVPAGAGRVPLAGVGVLFGTALLAALGGTLLLAAGRLAGNGQGARPVARAALWLAVGLAAAGLLLGAVRVTGLGGFGAGLLPLLGLALAAGWLATSLLATRPAALPLVSRIGPLALPLGVLGAMALAIAAAVSGVLGDGTYTTPSGAAFAASFLLGLAALEPTRAPGLRRAAFVVALLAPAVA
jgi:hypothetical protein